jgi:hypothetical protein
MSQRRPSWAGIRKPSQELTLGRVDRETSSSSKARAAVAA